MGFGLPLSATIAAASAVGAQLGQAKVDLAKLDLHTISSAAQVAYASTGRCVALEELSPRYLSRAPLDPWGHAPRLSCPGFEVRSAGPDGVFDTEDDVVSK
jgi:hypothetical protein